MLMLSKKFSSKFSRGRVKESMLMLSKKFSSKYLGDELRYLCLCYERDSHLNI